MNFDLDHQETCSFFESNKSFPVFLDNAKFWPVLLFILKHVHKQQQKMLFSDCPMPVLSDKINFDSFLETLKIYASKIPMKCSKKSQNFAMLKITIDVLFETCWIPCKKPHASSLSRTKFTPFCPSYISVHNSFFKIMLRRHQQPCVWSIYYH